MFFNVGFTAKNSLKLKKYRGNNMSFFYWNSEIIWVLKSLDYKCRVIFKLKKWGKVDYDWDAKIEKIWGKLNWKNPFWMLHDRNDELSNSTWKNKPSPHFLYKYNSYKFKNNSIQTCHTFLVHLLKFQKYLLAK
jgi:hypothetical protein